MTRFVNFVIEFVHETQQTLLVGGLVAIFYFPINIGLLSIDPN